jgi:hypothetical protein
LVAIAILHVKGEESVKIKISGIGKYPYLDINTKKIDFETLLVGKKKSKEIILHNSSKVRAVFTVK